jgi:uncharacterized membrane protein
MIYDKEMFHYLLLHFPIALFIIGYFFDAMYIVINTFSLSSYKDKSILLYTFSYWNISLAILLSFPTILSGFITDWSLYGHMENPLPVWTTHGTHMILSIFIFIIILFLKYKKDIIDAYFSEKTIFIIHTLAIIFFIHGAHIGAKLADRL